MPNKDRNKRSVRQARQRERAEREALAASQEAPGGAASKKKADSQASKKAPAKATTAKSDGLIGSIKGYFGAVRAEMHRVTWPSRTELTNYSVAVVASLIVFGVAIWLIDTGIVAALVGFTGLRG